MSKAKTAEEEKCNSSDEDIESSTNSSSLKSSLEVKPTSPSTNTRNEKFNFINKRI